MYYYKIPVLACQGISRWDYRNLFHRDDFQHFGDPVSVVIGKGWQSHGNHQDQKHGIRIFSFSLPLPHYNPAIP